MSYQQSVASCATTGARRRLGLGESAVIIVIIVVAVLMKMRGMPPQDVASVLGLSGLLAVLVVRSAQAGVRAGAARIAGRALLSPPLA